MTVSTPRAIGLWLLSIPLIACSGGLDAPAGPPSNAYLSDASVETDAAPYPSGLPCEVSNLLYTHCTGCHTDPPIGGATVALVTRDDLVAPSAVDPSVTVADRAVIRMRAAGAAPMPPATLSPVPSGEVDAFAAWVTSGMAAGTCADMPPPPTPTDTPTVCTSGNHLGTSERLETRMQPGGACNTCHSRDEGPIFSIAGTVFPTAHEPDGCVGASSGAIQVEITDATGAVFTLGVNSSGNFTRESSVVMPITARVLEDGRVRAMTQPVTTGDCNSCHTERGTMGAPGRIMEP